MKKLAIILMLALSVNSFAIGSATARSIAKQEVKYAVQVCTNKTDSLKKENSQLRAEIKELRVLVIELRQQLKELYDNQEKTNKNPNKIQQFH